MASSERAGRGAAVEGFVSRLVGDPANPPEVAVLTGYPGASSLEGHIRVYLRVDLGEYVDIPADAVLHRLDVPAAQDPLGPVYLWIKRDAELTRRQGGQAASKARFLSGEVQRDLLGGGQQQVGPTGIQDCTAAPAHCGNTAWPGCPGGGR
jgi:hypothetical protein